MPQATREFYRSQQRLAVLTISSGRRAWSRMGADFDRSWVTAGQQLLALSSAAQFAAADAATRYVPRLLTETGQPDDPAALVEASAFAGYAADGRELGGLLYGAVTESKAAVGQGASPGSALDRGGRWLDMVLHTLVADAGRQATGVEIAARPRMGWVRMVNPPCCSRCAILAGKHFRYNQGFQRHPRCDCVHIPALDDTADEFRTDPQALVRSGQVTDLSPAEAKALDEGADLGQVVNARRGASGLRGMTTTEGTTRRGLAGSRLNGRSRLTPEGIYRTASTREKTVALLKQHGYLV